MATKLLFGYVAFTLLVFAAISIWQGMFLTFLAALGIVIFAATGYALVILAIQETNW